MVNGAKLWITNSIEGDVLALLVKTDPEAKPRHRGMTMLITPTRDPMTKARAARASIAAASCPSSAIAASTPARSAFPTTSATPN